ncbi:hypothetical protein [Streptomyces sp. AC512_CC834]|uniref:hypothetical protein n=1 Tax=Streptomyces sp. AC512_CC834 TaxID=2823691 RepID=UPI0020B87001|nr:hypothetical protein [Streptomyces sp. AC512_CC834]
MRGMTGNARAALAISLCAAFSLLTAGCAGTGDDGRPSGTTAPAGETPGITSAPGRVEVRIADIDLAVTDAVAHLGPSGGTLSMSVRNDSTVPEHLGMVATSTGGRGVLAGAEGTKGTGVLTTAGILLQPGTTVTFGGAGGGPSVELPRARGTGGQRTLPLTLQFGVAGLVHVDARVSAR